LPTLTEQYDPQIRVFETYVSTDKLGQVRRDMFISDVRRNNEDSAKIIYTLYSSRIIEKLLTCLAMNEPCLLVGDTGCGKTTLTQHCASLFGKRLHVFNLSEGSDA
jgi:midasin